VVSPSQAVGYHAEDTACRFLQQQGQQVVARNFRCHYGELDLIMQDGEVLVFVEVRLRHNRRYGSGAESVTRTKQAKIIASALYYLQLNPALADHPARFDVVSVGSDPENEINWIKDAFTA